MSDDAQIKTDETALTLREIADALPDTSTIMARVGHSWWHLIYAARGGNWELAEYYLRRVNKLQETLKVLRPKHRARLERFKDEAMVVVTAAINSRDLEQLEAGYASATKLANELHVDSGYPYVKWNLPSEAPQGLELGPVS